MKIINPKVLNEILKFNIFQNQKAIKLNKIAPKKCYITKRNSCVK